MKFDVCLMNPPFNNGLYQKFMIKMFEHATINVSVAPATWLLGKKQNKKITKYYDEFGGVIETIDGNEYFDAAIGGVISINYCNQNKDEE